VDVTETIDIKIEALGKHASQVNLEEVGKWLREWAREEANGTAFEYAEAYRVMRLSEEESEK
jgi:LmbE family N-acetylglucosaminyl deacetylase